MSTLLNRLAATLGSNELLTDAAAMAPYLNDWRGRYQGRALAVLRPHSVEQVSCVVALCYETATPIVPQSGNTGLVGGATPDDNGRAVLLSLECLTRIREVDARNDSLTAEAGCVLADVQAAATKVGRLFPLSLASEGSARIGGLISTNAGGVHVLRYGSMRNLVLGLEVVLPDGRIWNGLRALRKDNTGYDLKQLFIGAEGTLGVVTAAVLRLLPQPAVRAVGWVALRDSIEAITLFERLRGSLGERISAFELIGRAALELVLRHIPAARDPLPEASAWVVLVELSDSDAAGDLAAALTAALAVELEQGWVIDAAIARSETECAALWALRENISEAQKREGLSIKHDVSLPVSRIPEFLARAEHELLDRWPDLRVVAFGHVGDGNLHYNLSRPHARDNSEFIAISEQVSRRVHDLVVDHGGSISAEHGIGRLKRDEITRYKSEVELQLMLALRRTLDPRGIMNPGCLPGGEAVRDVGACNRVDQSPGEV